MSAVENLSIIANKIGTEIARSMGFAGVVLAVLDYGNNLGICCTVSNQADRTAMDGIARSIEKYSESIGADVEVFDLVSCVHCKQDVARRGDVAAIKRHMMTCSASPLVHELATAKARIAQLEVELADALSDRADVAPTWTPAPKAGG